MPRAHDDPSFGYREEAAVGARNLRTARLNAGDKRVGVEKATFVCRVGERDVVQQVTACAVPAAGTRCELGRAASLGRGGGRSRCRALSDRCLRRGLAGVRVSRICWRWRGMGRAACAEGNDCAGEQRVPESSHDYLA